MNRTALNNFGYPNNYTPRFSSSSNPPSPATSSASDLDNDLSAAFCDSFSTMDCSHEVSPYAHSVLNHSSDMLRASSVPTDANRSTRASNRTSRSSKINQESAEDGHVLIETRVIRALITYVRETRLRVHENETKLHNMEKAMEALRKNHEQQMLVLAKSFVFLQNQLAAQKQNPLLNSSKSDDNSLSNSRLSEIFPSNSGLFKPGHLSAPNLVNEENSDFEDLDAVHQKRKQSNDQAHSCEKPLYARVKKKASAPPESPTFTFPPSNQPEKTIFLPQPPPIPCLDLSDGENKSLKKDSSSSQSQEQICEFSNPVENLLPSFNPSPRNSETGVHTGGARDLKKYRPLPETPRSNLNNETAASATKRLSFDGCSMSPESNRSRNSGRYEATNSDEKRPHSQSLTTQPRPKTSQLFSKFKKKLKDTKRIVTRAASKDSVMSESFCISEPVFDDCVEAALATGSVNVITCKDDSNNNSFFRSTDNISPTSRPSFSSPPRQTHSSHRRLDSIGDNESRSTDTSDIHLNEHCYNSPNPSAQLYRRHQTPPLQHAAKTRWLESKAPSSPNLLQGPSKSPVRRSCSLDVELCLSDITSEPEFPDPPSDSTSTTTPSQGSLFCSNGISSSEDSLNNKLDEVGYILDDVHQQQEEIEKLETMSSSAMEPPPKPSRPGFRGAYAPQTSAPIYQPTAPPTGGMYPPAPRAPGIPPKNIRIMTPEELVNHEAQTNLQKRQMEEAELQRLLDLQKREAAEDDAWIRNQEMKADQIDAISSDSEHPYHSADDLKKNRSAGVGPPPKPSRSHMAAAKVAPPAPPKLKFEEVKPTPTMKLDREGDNVYRDTMSVVKSVLQSNHRVMEAGPDDIFTFVKNIGKALKELCTSLSQEMTILPEQFHREIDMAQKTTNKDLSQIINQMKLVRKFFATTQVDDYKKCLMAANQVLAIDAKNLLDVVDKARFYKLEQQRDSTTPTNESYSLEEATSNTPSNSTPSASAEDQETEG